MNVFARAWRAIAACIMSAVSAVSVWLCPPACPPEPRLAADHPIMARDARADNYAATDALGRSLPDFARVGGPREDRTVGLFYWTWHVAHAQALTDHYRHLPVNVSQTVAEYPAAAHDLDFPGWGPLNMPHHWNEPLFGYYDTDDRWVLRKHAEMLANAGVDVVIFDNTNGRWTWKESYDVLFEVFDQARGQGVNTPKIAFLLPFGPSEDTAAQLRSLYHDVYEPGRYQDLWFYWKGRPLIMAYPDALNKKDSTDKTIAKFFSFRPGNPYTDRGSAGQWGWLSVYPQRVYRNWLGVPEQMAVGVAQNYSAAAGLTAMNGEGVFGRTYTSKGYDTREQAVRLGANFAEQWERALEIDPEFVFVTGFNEWVAGRHEEWMGVTNAFPDQYNDWFSRDIEPSKGQLGDDYYYQLCDYIRRYKGVRPVPEYSAGEEAVYYAYPGNTFDRDDAGYGGLRYTDQTGRNDIALAKVSRDASHLTFTAECAEDLSPSGEPAWMRLFISTGGGPAWETFQYAIGREAPGVVERSKGGWDWEEIGLAEWRAQGSQLRLTVPKALLGLSGEAFTLNFKWSDNMQHDGDAMDFYLYGDTAPLGRFCWVYRAA
ncbi:MAG: hypothetical protein LBB75_02695 [Oscillospiraceae bacterium]|jgi:hypothetical protein|nr:hypothetical protein [Oscillospiraceae bacterium]